MTASRYMAYDKQRLVELRGALDAAVWHLGATRFDHAFCEEFRSSIAGICPRLEELRDAVLQPVIDSDALETYLGIGLSMVPIVVDGHVLDEAGEIRGFLESLDGGVSNDDGRDDDHDGTDTDDVVVATMLGLTPVQAAAYWTTLDGNERRNLLTGRPDLVRAAMLGGAALTGPELELLEGTNAFTVFSAEIAVDWEVSANLRVATVEVGGGMTLVAMKMSDGSVQVVIVERSHVGVGVETGGAQGEGEASVGVFSSAQQVFVFQSEADAAAAATKLRGAIVDNDWGDVATSVVDRLLGPWWNLSNDFDAAVDRLWEDYGAVRSDQVGVYGDVEVEVEDALAELDVNAHLEVSYYDTDVTELASEEARRGVIVSGSLGGQFEAGDAGPSAAASGSFTVDAFVDDSGDGFMRVTLDGSFSTGAVAELVDGLGVEVDVGGGTGLRGQIEITVPVSAESSADVVAMTTALATGQLDEVLAPLLDDAEIRVTADATTTATVEAEVDLAGGVAEGNLELSATASVNLTTQHQYPGGEMYSQNEFDNMIDDAQQELESAALPVRPGRPSSTSTPWCTTRTTTSSARSPRRAPSWWRAPPPRPNRRAIPSTSSIRTPIRHRHSRCRRLHPARR